MLREKYGDCEYIDYIISREVCLGLTDEMLIDAVGKPVTKDFDVSVSKHKETWKYDHESGNKYKTRIFLEDGVVVRVQQRN